MVALTMNSASRREGRNVGRGAHPTAPEGGRAPRDLRFRASAPQTGGRPVRLSSRFFAFGVGAAVVGDGDFVDEETALCRTRGGDDFQRISIYQLGKMAGIFWERKRR